MRGRRLQVRRAVDERRQRIERGGGAAHEVRELIDQVGLLREERHHARIVTAVHREDVVEEEVVRDAVAAAEDRHAVAEDLCQAGRR